MAPAIRNKYSEVLAKGSRKTIEASDEKGLDVFQRSWGDTTLTVGLNITDKETEYSHTQLFTVVNHYLSFGSDL